jgi:undecaprenyl-diphosphatase
MQGVLPTAVRRRTDPTTRYGLRVNLLAVAFVLVTVPFAILLLEVLAEGPLTSFDTRVANWMNSWVHGSPALVRTLEIISLFGLPPWLAVCVTAGASYALWRGRRRLAAYLVVTVVGGSLVDTAVKLAVDRPRPLVDHPIDTAFGTSFPSGHAMASTLTYGALLLVFLPVLSRRWRWIAEVGALTLVVAIGSSRLLLGVHFVTDVVGGYVLGVAWLLAASAVFEIWREEEVGHHAGPSEVLHGGVEPEAGPALRGDDHAPREVTRLTRRRGGRKRTPARS